MSQRVSASGWHTVQQDQIPGFADATGDQKWIHVDPERSASGQFGRPEPMVV